MQCIQLIFRKDTNQFNGGGTVFLTNDVGKLDIQRKKMKFTLNTKINSKMDHEFKCKMESSNTCRKKKKLGKNFWILVLGKEILDMTPKAQTIKIFNKLGLIKICVHLLLRRHSFPFPP